MSRRRILFVAEAATLAQVVRLRVLASQLDSERYDVHFACQSFPELVFSDCTFTQWPLYSVDPKVVLATTESGARPYNRASLSRYVEDDLALLDKVRPDLIVGDLRLSLCISAPHRRIPFATLINAYWHPSWNINPFPIPDHPLVSILGPTLASAFFPLARPLVFRHFAEPVNTLRRRFGLSTLGSLREVLTHGDFTLYPDSPALIRLPKLPDRHFYLGPVLWSPQIPLPAWWKELTSDLPVVYLTLGSSGRKAVLPSVIRALSDLPIQLVISTAGGADPVEDSPRWSAPYLPGTEICQRADLIVCNGGASTAYQALAAGKPVLGLPSNLDQFLSMSAIEKSGAGLQLRTSQTRALRHTVTQMLEQPRFRQNAERIQLDFHKHRADVLFSEFVESIFR